MNHDTPMAAAVWHRGASVARVERHGQLIVVADVIEPDAATGANARQAAAAFCRHVPALGRPQAALDALRGAVDRAHVALFDPEAPQRALFDLAGAVSLAAVIAVGPHAAVVAIGSCRCYRARAGRVECLDAGHAADDPMRPPSAAAPRGRDLVSEALGLRERVRPSLSEHELRPGDRLLLCTSAVWSSLAPAELAAAFAEPATVPDARHALIQRVWSGTEGAALAIAGAGAPEHRG